MMSPQLIQQCNDAIEAFLRDEYQGKKFSVEDTWTTDTEMHKKVQIQGIDGIVHVVVDRDLNPKIEGNQ